MSEYAETFKDKTILINGGVGAIGGNLTRIFARATYRMMRAQIEATQLGGTGLYFAEIEK